MIEDLEAIADTLDALYPMVQGPEFGGCLQTEYAASLKASALEAKSILDDELGPLNDYSMKLGHFGGLAGRPSAARMVETSRIIRAAIRSIRRKRTGRPPAPGPADIKPYVSPDRIAALQSLGKGKWDFARLIELCRELNTAAENRCHMATAMLLRTILNHVPPVLGFGTFKEVANNYGGGKSFGASMQNLERSLRNIADMHLHSPIRPQEDVPSATQVDFSADLDVLLGEVIRVARSDTG